MLQLVIMDHSVLEERNSLNQNYIYIIQMMDGKESNIELYWTKKKKVMLDEAQPSPT